MKVIYEFDPTEDSEDLACFQKANDYHSVLWDISNIIRNYRKYLEPDPEAPLLDRFDKLEKAFKSIEEEMVGFGIWEL